MKEIEFKQVTLPNGETIGYRHYARGEKVLVLIHGNLASSKFFDELIMQLPDTFSVYAMDLRGHGMSTYKQPLDDLRDFARDVKLFVDELKLETFDLLGWSMGGAVSLLFTSNYGYMVNRLFLVGAIPVNGYNSYAVDSDGKKTQLRTKEEIIQDPTKRKFAKAAFTGDKKFYEEIWNSAIYNKKKPEPEVFDVHVQETLRQRNMPEVYYCVAKYNLTDSFNGVSMGTEEIYKIKVPTILVHGEDDLLVSVDAARFTQECIGENAELVVWDECGHSPFVDRLDDLVTLISR